MKLKKRQKRQDSIIWRLNRTNKRASGDHTWAMSRGYIAVESDFTGREIAEMLRNNRRFRWRNKCFWRSRRDNRP